MCEVDQPIYLTGGMKDFVVNNWRTDPSVAALREALKEHNKIYEDNCNVGK